MTFTNLVNIFVLQWFFVRLTKHLTKDRNGDYTVVRRVSLQYWVVPVSGYLGIKYRYVGGSPKFKYLSLKKLL